MKTARKNRIKKQELRIKNRFLSCSRFIIHNSKFIASGGGFTLVEIIVAITILTTLIVVAVTALNPKGQLDKAKDAVRQNDLRQIKISLDIYYNDKNCYPIQVSPFTAALKDGTEWKEGSTVYMRKVPRDVSKTPYNYITDATVCPQWATIFAKLSQPSTLATRCPLISQSQCTPVDFDDTYACVSSGITNCPVLFASRLGPIPTQPAGVTGTTTPTPTPTPVSSDQSFSVAQPPGTNPEIYQGVISPLFQAVGKTQKLSVDVADSVGNVASVSATVKSDTKVQNYVMSLTGGTPADGTWSTSWTVDDTTIKRLMITIEGTDSAGNTSSFDIAIR